MRRSNRRAFTLMELTVTLVIIAIIGAALLWAYARFVASGHDTEATERLSAVAARQAQAAREWGRYTDYPADLPPVAGGSSLTSVASTGPGEVSVALGDQGNLGLAVLSKSGTCVRMRLAPLLAGGDVVRVNGVTGACTGASSLAAGENVHPTLGGTSVRD